MSDMNLLEAADVYICSSNVSLKPQMDKLLSLSGRPHEYGAIQHRQGSDSFEFVC